MDVSAVRRHERACDVPDGEVQGEAAVTERELQNAVIECARVLGWRVAHFRPAQTSRGWRTAVSADGAGFPDLVLVRGGWLLFFELKAARGRTSSLQEEWLADLDGVAGANDQVLALVVIPQDWTSGFVEGLLRNPAGVVVG